MRRFLIVLFVLCSITLLAQSPRPTNNSFASLSDYIRNFDFIASSTILPSIAKKGIKHIIWNDDKPLEYVSNGSSWVLQKNVKLPTANEPSWIDYKNSQVLSFSPSQTNLVYFSTQLPHRYKPGKNIEFHIHIAYPDTQLASSVWELTYSWSAINDNFPAPTTVTKTILSSGVIDKHTMSMIASIDGTNKDESSILICSLKRIGGDSLDTYSNSIYFISADFHIPINKLGETNGHF